MLAALHAALIRVRQFFSRDRLAAEQDEEFRFHLEMEIEHNRRAGMSEAEARRVARQAFGGEQRFREETRDARGIVGLDDFLREIAFALRRMRRAPGFAASVAVTLGMGLGTAVGIGAIVYGVLVRELPYREPAGLVRVSLATPGIPAAGTFLSPATYVHFSSARSLETLGAYFTNSSIDITDGEQSERITAALMTPGTFRLLHAAPIVGRSFVDADTAWGATTPVLISEALWDRRYGRDPDIVGTRIALNRGARQIVGVLPRSFDFPAPSVDVWYPIGLDAGQPSLNGRYYEAVARLAAGVSVAQAEAELNSMVSTLPARFPQITPAAVAASGARVTVQPLKTAVIAPVRGQFVLLAALVGIVMLVAVTNIVTLFLLRAERTHRETAVALSLGATRSVLVRRFVVEGLLLGAVSIVIALPVTALIIITKLGFATAGVPRLHEIALTPAIITLLAVAALSLGALIGLSGLGQADTAHLAERLRSSRVTMSLQWRRVQRILVAAQIAFAFSLVVAAGLLGRSFWNLKNVKLGFAYDRMTTFNLSLPWKDYSSYGATAVFHAALANRLSSLPGVAATAVATELPLHGRATAGPPIRVAAVDAPERGTIPLRANVATAGFFDVLGMPLLRGRTFAAGDLRAAAPAAILSASAARMLFGSADPIGKLLRRTAESGDRDYTFQVVGIVGDVVGDRIEDGLTATVYFPLLRDGDGLPKDSVRLPFVARSAYYVVRGAVLSPETVQQVVHALDPQVPAVRVGAFAVAVAAATARVRITLILLALAGGAALFLGIVGVYSIVSYAAAGRLREFAVRLAFGAAPRGISTLILREGIGLAAAGISAGALLAALGARLLRSLLFGVSAIDAPEFAMAAVLLTGISLCAALFPARRAARTDPAVVLRGE